MMLDEPNKHHYLPHRPNNLSLDVSPWPPPSSPSPSSSCYDADPQLHSPSFFALSRFLPSNVDPYEGCEEEELDDLYSSDEFRMYDFKVRRCTRGRSHDWTECPYAHPGEKARRRDPRKYHYSGVACPDFRKGACKKGDSCEFAHGVFECWLHPTRYRTQPCKDGINCRRRVCFFAHTPEQLRVVPPSGGSQQSPRSVASDAYDGSPARHHQHLQTPLEAYFPKSILMSSSSPTSTLVSPPLSPPAASPPLSPSQPTMRRSPGATHVNDVLTSLRQLHLSKWGSPRGAATMMNNGFCGLPAVVGRRGVPASPAVPPRTMFDTWDEPVERVESGRDLRARIAERLSKENGLERSEDEAAVAAAPDVGWVSDLLN